MESEMIQYFGYGTNRNYDMMVHMVGRESIEGIPAKMPGYELCIQKLNDISNEVMKDAPAPQSPREIVRGAFNEDFELYIIRPNADTETYGTIWYLTPNELKLVHEWELLEFGMQEVIKGMAIGENGQMFSVDTHGTLNPNAPIDRVIEGKDYDDYIISKDEILKVADRVRKEYLERNAVSK